MALIQTLCTSSGPGSADLAAAWTSAFSIVDAHVWGDTTDYMFQNFAAQVDGAYPNTLVVELDTMEIRYFSGGGPTFTDSVVNEILAEEADPCAE